MTTATELSRIIAHTSPIDLVPDALVGLRADLRAFGLAALAAQAAAMTVAVTYRTGDEDEELSVVDPTEVVDVTRYRLVVALPPDVVNLPGRTISIRWEALAAVELRSGMTPDDLRTRALDAAGIA